MGERQPVRARHVRWSPVGDALVLYNSITDTYFQLNEVGSAIWELLDGSLDERRIADEIAAEFDVEPETALSDVTEYVSGLLEAGLLEV